MSFFPDVSGDSLRRCLHSARKSILHLRKGRRFRLVKKLLQRNREGNNGEAETRE